MMAFRVLIVALLLAALGNAAAGEVIDASQRGFWVVDGDSIHYKNRKLRLCGINAPEKDKPHYTAARQALINLTRNQVLRLHFIERDKYEREVVVLFPAAPPESAALARVMSINESMVRAGFAWHFKRYSKNCAPHLTPLQLAKSQSHAARAKRGMWD